MPRVNQPSRRVVWLIELATGRRKMRCSVTRRLFCGSILGGAVIGPLGCHWLRGTQAAPPFDPAFSTAVETLRAIRSGVISCRELIDHVYGRIDRFNERIHSFVTLNEEQARDQAKIADEAIARGDRLGRLHGLPILVKDLFQTAGLRTTCGSKSLQDYVPERDAVAVARE